MTPLRPTWMTLRATLWAAVAVCGVGWVGTGAARAQEVSPVTATLEWQRGAGAERCLGSLGVRQEVAERLGRTVFVDDPASADVHVVGRIEREGQAFHAVLELRDAEGAELGVRELTSTAADCSAVDQPLTLIIAMMINVPRERLGLTVRAPERSLDLRASVGAVGTWGFLPGWGLGIRAGIELHASGLWPIEVDALFFWPRDAEQDGAGAELSAWEVGLHVCPRLLERDRFELGLCVGARVGRVKADPFGLDYVDPALARTTVRPSVSGRFSVRLVGPLRVGMHAGITTPTARHEYTFLEPDGTTQLVHQPRIVAFLAGLGLTIEL